MPIGLVCVQREDDFHSHLEDIGLYCFLQRFYSQFEELFYINKLAVGTNTHFTRFVIGKVSF